MKVKDLNYNFEELEILKTLAKFPNDPDRALDLIKTGVDDYEYGRIKTFIRKLYDDRVWNCEYAEDGDSISNFKIDFREFILNYPNPIPDRIRSRIDTEAIIEKLPCSNLDRDEINYITALLKKDVTAKY